MLSFKSITAGLVATVGLACLVRAQVPSTAYNRQSGRNEGPIPNNSSVGGWRSPSSAPRTTTAGPANAIGVRETSAYQAGVVGSAEQAAPVARARVTNGNGTLPSDQGQVWREYDITPYTARVTSTNRPERAIVDWILRETGYEAWHGEAAAVLTADCA